MIAKYFHPLIIFFPLLAIQLLIVPLLSINSVVPDLILILLVFYTLQTGQIYGTILGFILGLFTDLITGNILGSMMFAKTLSGFVAGYFYNENKKSHYFNSYLFLLIVLLCALIDSVAFTLISSFDISKNIIMIIFEQGILPAIYTAVVASLIVFFYPKRNFD